MENLFERLKPEYKTSLEQKFTSYPYTKQMIENELRSKKHVIDLDFGTVNTLSEVLEMKKIDFLDIYEMFEHQ